MKILGAAVYAVLGVMFLVAAAIAFSVIPAEMIHQSSVHHQAVTPLKSHLWLYIGAGAVSVVALCVGIFALAVAYLELNAANKSCIACGSGNS